MLPTERSNRNHACSACGPTSPALLAPVIGFSLAAVACWEMIAPCGNAARDGTRSSPRHDPIRPFSTRRGTTRLALKLNRLTARASPHMENCHEQHVTESRGLRRRAFEVRRLSMQGVVNNVYSAFIHYW